MTVDAYGIPQNTFGRVPEPFYGMLGRVVMVSALLEMRLLDFRTALGELPEEEYAGDFVTALLAGCQKELTYYGPSFVQQAKGLLHRVRAAFDERNVVVHNVWPSPTMDRAYGYRPVRAKRRSPTGQPYQSRTVGESQLRDLITESVILVGELDRLRQAAPHSRRPPVPDAGSGWEA